MFSAERAAAAAARHAPLSLAAAGPAKATPERVRENAREKNFSRRGALRRLRRVEEQHAPQFHDHDLGIFVQDQCELVADLLGLRPAP